MRRWIALLFISASAHGAPVVEVHSGDSLTVLEQGEPLKLFLANIDAPEAGQAFGTASRKSLEQLCKGKQARYEIEKTPQAGEIRARVTCGDVDASREQLRRGMAWVLPRPDVDPSFTAIQDFVWRDKTGLWADADPVPPWEWAGQRK